MSDRSSAMAECQSHRELQPKTMTYITRIACILLAFALSGCISVPDINAGFYRVGKAWQLDNQKSADEYRFRVIEADPLTAYQATKQTFIALGMPVEAGSLSGGVLFAENQAPAPLTKEEWLKVKEVETPRLKELGGSLFSFSDDPKIYIITVRARLRALDANRVMVAVDYEMSSPQLKSHGFQVPPHAPPTAVKLGSLKFWKQLEVELSKMNAPPPRLRKWNEET